MALDRLSHPHCVLHRNPRTGSDSLDFLSPQLAGFLAEFRRLLGEAVAGNSPVPHLIFHPTFPELRAVFKELRQWGCHWLHALDDRLLPRIPGEDDPFFLSGHCSHAAFDAWLPYMGDALVSRLPHAWEPDMLDVSNMVLNHGTQLVGFEVLCGGSDIHLASGPVEQDGLGRSVVRTRFPVSNHLRTGFHVVVEKSRLS